MTKQLYSILFFMCISFLNGCSKDDTVKTIVINMKSSSVYEVDGKTIYNPNELIKLLQKKGIGNGKRRVMLEGVDGYIFKDVSPLWDALANIGVHEVALLYSSQKNVSFDIELPFGGTRVGERIKVSVLADKYQLNGSESIITFEQLKEQIGTLKAKVVWIDLFIASDVAMNNLVKFFMFIHSKKLRLAWDRTDKEETPILMNVTRERN